MKIRPKLKKKILDSDKEILFVVQHRLNIVMRWKAGMPPPAGLLLIVPFQNAASIYEEGHPAQTRPALSLPSFDQPSE